MTYITGDTHRDLSRFFNIELNEDDMVIILGDVGINYCLNGKDKELKDKLKKIKAKLFCVRGNHEERPENISTYKEVDMFGGKVFIEDNYPNLIFPKDGEIYDIDNNKVLVLGGAYSIDKDYRILFGHTWFKDEQLSIDELDSIYEKIKDKHIDIILSHTCPHKYEPNEMFLKGIDQSKIDRTMEDYFDKIEETIDYKKWYCGHYHTEKQVDKIEFMFGRIKVFNKDEYYPKYLDGFEIIRDYCPQKNKSNKQRHTCPKCKSRDVVIIRGNGNYIDGLDDIGISCNKCEKVYGYTDVPYQHSCPREL